MSSSQTPTYRAIDSVPSRQAADFRSRAGSYLIDDDASKRPRWVARAPGFLDVMGGIAEYTGAQTLGAPLASGVSVAVQARDDRRIVVRTIDSSRQEIRDPGAFDLSILDEGSSAASGRAVASQLDGTDGSPVRAVAGALYALRVSGKAGRNECGLTVVIEDDVTSSADGTESAPLAVAVLLAIGRAWNLDLDPIECAHLALRAENDVLGVPCGISAAMCSLYGLAGQLTHVGCHTNEVLKPLALPAEATVVGIESGARHPAALEKYVHARVATFMGRLVVDRIIAAQNGQPIRWNGSLAQLSIGDYVDHLRDRIPTRITGACFLERLGETGDPLTRIDPKKTYKIRSRTEHHIYESARARSFVERLAHAARTHNRSALTQAGELMYASHWSYGQRCGLGSVETDRLVSSLRRKAAEAGIYGARVCGCGAGGRIAVLMANNQTARDALHEVVGQYEKDTARSATILECGSPGALEFGVQEV